jgi:hypothetical protein
MELFVAWCFVVLLYFFEIYIIIRGVFGVSGVFWVLKED